MDLLSGKNGKISKAKTNRAGNDGYQGVTSVKESDLHGELGAIKLFAKCDGWTKYTSLRCIGGLATVRSWWAQGTGKKLGG